MARYTLDMLTAMLRLDEKCEFVVYSPAPVDIALPSGRWSLRFPTTNKHRLWTHWLQTSLPMEIARDRITVLWGQNHGLPLRLAHKCQRLLTLHDLTTLVLPATTPFRSRVVGRPLLAASLKAADAVVTDSRATARLASRYSGRSMSDMTVIYPGSRVCKARTTRELARSLVSNRFGLNTSFLLAVGTVEPRKDLATLMRAHAELPEAPVLVIVGEPGWRCRSTLTTMRKLELNGRLRVLSRVSDEELQALYAAADMLVASSLYEGFGLPVLEAMSQGCPVVCSWSSSLPEVGGVAARYYPAGDSDHLAQTIGRLLSTPAELDVMSREGIEQARLFDDGVAGRRLFEVMRSLDSR